MSGINFDLALSNTNMCECYRKLNVLGIPLFINEENDEFSEFSETYGFETAFKLPYFVKINEKISEYPSVDLLDLPAVFIEMAKVIPCLSDFETNLVSFWALDVFIEALKTVQSYEFSHKHQKIALMWVAYMFNYVKKHNPTRKDLFRHLKIAVVFPDHLESNDGFDKIDEELYKMSKSDKAREKEKLKVYFGSETHVATQNYYILPYPPKLKEKEENAEVSSLEGVSISTGSYSEENVNPVAQEEVLNQKVSEINLAHMQVILEILYRIFARLWVNLEILDTFFSMPNVETVVLPFKLNLPKLKLQDSKTDAFGRKTSLEFHGEAEDDKNEFILPLQASEEARLWFTPYSKVSASVRSGKDKDKSKKMTQNNQQT